MKPSAFYYERPASLREAGILLNEQGVFAKAVAGSQSLGPMLNLRLARAGRLGGVALLPVVVFPLQRHIVRGPTMGAVKG